MIVTVTVQAGTQLISSPVGKLFGRGCRRKKHKNKEEEGGVIKKCLQEIIFCWKKVRFQKSEVSKQAELPHN